MRAVLMAGGSGTRLRPLTCDLPKPMVPILNKPIAEHIINLLKKHQITEIIVALYYLPESIKDYFQEGDGLGVQLKYSVEEDQPLGTAGCVKNIADLLDDTFVVISGDSITDFDLSGAIAFHREKQSKATLILSRVSHPMDFGVVITDQEHRITRFLEKPSTSEIFSDTVNTGTYILEPEVLEYLNLNEECDFSNDLFPILLEQGEPMYGYIAEGYWCDVGHLDSYRQAQYDALQNKVSLEWGEYTEKNPGIWVGKNTYIDPSARLHPPLLIGNHSRIGASVTVEAGTVIGDHVTISAHADLKQSIIWNGVSIAEEAYLAACIIARGCRIERRAEVLEGAVVGPLCVVGEEAKINRGIRVWPGKRIEAGATLNINLIWGNTARKNLFGDRGVSGLANIDITPEFAVKLGASYGSTFKPGSQVIVSRDQRPVSRMVTRSMVSGLMSVGVNIQNLESTAIPICRTITPKLDVVGGLHVRAHPERPDDILIEFFDQKGINISKSKQKKIEGAYFKEDIRRVRVQDIGNVSYPSQVSDTYRESFQTQLNVEAVRSSGSKIVIDYAYSVSGAVLPELLAKFGCDAVVLNASLRPTPISNEERETLLAQLGQVIEALKANLGVQVSANGEQFILVDEAGQSIRGQVLTALMVEMVLTAEPRQTVVVPVHVSSAVEQIVRRHDGKVFRTKANPGALMEAAHSIQNVVLGGSGETGFIFPKLHPGFDAMFSIAKLLEMLTIQERSLVQVRLELPQVYYRSVQLRCPGKDKGALMRHLIEINSPENIELHDGVKITNAHNDNWVLVLPDAEHPIVHLYVNSEDKDWVEQSLKAYRQKIQTFIQQIQGNF